jgi:hypothetical protein
MRVATGLGGTQQIWYLPFSRCGPGLLPLIFAFSVRVKFWELVINVGRRINKWLSQIRLAQRYNSSTRIQFLRSIRRLDNMNSLSVGQLNYSTSCLIFQSSMQSMQCRANIWKRSCILRMAWKRWRRSDSDHQRRVRKWQQQCEWILTVCPLLFETGGTAHFTMTEMTSQRFRPLGGVW